MAGVGRPVGRAGGSGSWSAYAGRPPVDFPEYPVLDEEKQGGTREYHQQERDDVGEDQPIFLVMRPLFKEPDCHAQRQQRGDHLDEPGKEPVEICHGLRVRRRISTSAGSRRRSW